MAQTINPEWANWLKTITDPNLFSVGWGDNGPPSEPSKYLPEGRPQMMGTPDAVEKGGYNMQLNPDIRTGWEGENYQPPEPVYQWIPVDQYGWQTMPGSPLKQNIYTMNVVPVGTVTDASTVGTPYETDRGGGFGGFLGVGDWVGKNITMPAGEKFSQNADWLIPLIGAAATAGAGYASYPAIGAATAGAGVGAGAGAGIGVGSSIGMGELTAAEMAAMQAGVGGSTLAPAAAAAAPGAAAAGAGAGIGVGSSIGMGELTAAEMAAMQAGVGGSTLAPAAAAAAAGAGAAGTIGTATGLTAAEMVAAGATTADMAAYGFTAAEIAAAAAGAPGILSQIGSGILNNPGASILAAGTIAGLASGGSLMGSAPEATTSPGGTKYTPEQQSLLKAYTDYYAGLAGDTAVPGYAGNRVAPINETQQRAEDLLTGYTPFAKTDLGMGASGTLQDVMAGGSGKYFEDQFRNVVENPMLRNWTETVVPELTGTFAKKGLLYGTGREEATLKSGRTLAETLAMGRSDLALKMEQQRLAGVSGATQMGNLGLDETTGISSGLSLTGAQKQATGQKQADADYEAWLRTQPGSRPQDPVIQSILGLSPYYEPNTVVSGGEVGMLGPLLNAAALYYGQKR